jgi:cytochrome c-type biogenesis protein CcmE
MNRKQKIRLWGSLSIVTLLSIATGLILFALKQNINLFYTPTQLLDAQTNPDQAIRMGGYVKMKSVHYDPSGEKVNFIVTDRVHELEVSYEGVLPNLFREGQTVVVTGKLNNHTFMANEVLAKHDEKYMPPQLAKELKQGKIHAA